MITINYKNMPTLNRYKLNYLISEKGREWVKSEMENMRNTIQGEKILSLVPQNRGAKFIYDLFKVTHLEEYPRQIRNMYFEVTLNYTKVEFYWCQYVGNSTLPQDAKLVIRETSPNQDIIIDEYFVDVTESGEFFWINNQGRAVNHLQILFKYLIIR